MALIRVLDSATIDKIAAGEVVERPASVVKELVENAMDAGADTITVEVKGGGIEFLRVTDNGSGMEQDQVRTAFFRHATSKIQTAEDLHHVSSLGFRGEALSSIAAVSKVEIITKTKDSLTGIRMVLEGGVEKDFGAVGAPEGTTFLVRNLFYNTPVRRKFLKTPATEGGYIVELLEHLALSRPDISFKLILDNRERIHTNGSGELLNVIYNIYGREVVDNVFPFRHEVDGFLIEGYLGKSTFVRPNRNYELFSINGRYIKSAALSKAVEEGYKEYLMQHRFPFCVLNLKMPTEWVDVNVHPTKMEVRFSDAPELYREIAGSIRQALGNTEMIPASTLEEKMPKGPGEKLPVGPKEMPLARTPEPYEAKRRESYRVMEEIRYQQEVPETVRLQESLLLGQKQVARAEQISPEVSSDPVNDKGFEGDAGSKEVMEASEEVFFHEEKEPAPSVTEQAADVTDGMPRMAGDVAVEQTVVVQKPQQLNLFEEKILTASNRSKYRFIGQVFDTYWLIQYEDQLMIMDQHAAHEKVKYERLMKQYREKQVLSQHLMPPIIVSLSGAEESVLQSHLEIFSQMGFEIEEFGGNEYALRSVPVDLYGCSEKEMFLEVLEELAGDGSRSIRVIEEKIASMSCKAAVKGNNTLSSAEAEELMDELMTLENPYNCPHGRPTIIKISKDEMEKRFKRIV